MKGVTSLFGDTGSQMDEAKSLSLAAKVSIIILTLAIIPLTAYALKPRFGDIMLFSLPLNALYGIGFAVTTYCLIHGFIFVVKQLLVGHDKRTQSVYVFMAVVCALAFGRIVMIQVAQLRMVSELKRKDFDSSVIQTNPLLADARSKRERAESAYSDMFTKVNAGKGDDVSGILAKAQGEIGKYRAAALRDTTGAVKAGASAVTASALAAQSLAKGMQSRAESNARGLEMLAAGMVSAQKYEKAVQDSLLRERGRMGQFDSPVAWAVELLLVAMALVLAGVQLVIKGKAEKLPIEFPQRPPTVTNENTPAWSEEVEPEEDPTLKKREHKAVPLREEWDIFTPESECPKNTEGARCWIIYRYENKLLAEGDYTRVTKAIGGERSAPWQWLKSYIARQRGVPASMIKPKDAHMKPKPKFRRGLDLTPTNGTASHVTE